MRKTLTERDRGILNDIRFFATMQNQDLGERLLRAHVRDIAVGRIPFGRAMMKSRAVTR
jgi:hypothetical protein